MQEVHRKRPIGISVIAIIQMVAAIILLLSSFGVITTVLAKSNARGNQHSRGRSVDGVLTLFVKMPNPSREHAQHVGE